MNDPAELVSALKDPALRRVWLLCKALECVPLDRAIELASMADQFVAGARLDTQTGNTGRLNIAFKSQIPVAEGLAEHRSEAPPAKTSKDPRSKLPLSPEERETLLLRLARGARNRELASEFGLSPRQVQGIRMSQARNAKFGRSYESRSPQELPESIEEVVRFLRRQDDVVVRQNDGEFLVNGRFRLGAGQLVERANRMRARQGKPPFNRQGTAEPEVERTTYPPLVRQNSYGPSHE